MPRRLLPLLVLAVLFGPACSAIETMTGSGGAEEARWAVDPTVELADDTTVVPILVNEVGCASGRDATGRIRADVEYGPDVITVTVLVARPEGDQDCQGNPNTPFVLTLDEPVNGRRLVNGATSEIAQRPIEFVGDGPGEGPDQGPIDGLRLEFEDDADERIAFLVQALHARAQDASELEDLGDLSLASDRVELILGDSGVSRVIDTPALADPANWELDTPEGYEGFTGPFSALDLLDGVDHLTVTIGDHPHCAGPPRPAPDHLTGLTRVGIQPADIDSCIAWFTVDLYLDETGRVQAIVLDLFGP